MPWAFEEQWTLLKDKFSLSVASDQFALSVDMDAFPQSVAPGVSAPQAFGLDPRLALRLIDELGSRLRHLGIYALNPMYDRDAETSRLAAKLVFQFLEIA